MLEGVLELLDSLSRRTAMYVHPVDISTVQSYLHGLEDGCRLGGLEVSRDAYVAAAASRGWEFRATGIVWHMESKGFAKEAVIQELIAVEVEAFRRAAAIAA
jgi:hypothetical protein